MAQSIIVREFINEICNQVNSKKAQGLLSSELISHIEDQKLSYIKEGMKEEIAEERAVLDMGDPVTVGENFNQIVRPKREWIGPAANIIMWVIAGIIAAASLIFGIGIIISMVSIHPGDSLIAVIVGGGLILFGLFLDFVFVSIWKLISTTLFYGSMVRDYKKRKKRGELHELHKKY